jgi:hypothetical protein
MDAEFSYQRIVTRKEFVVEGAGNVEILVCSTGCIKARRAGR